MQTLYKLNSDYLASVRERRRTLVVVATAQRLMYIGSIEGDTYTHPRDSVGIVRSSHPGLAHLNMQDLDRVVGGEWSLLVPVDTLTTRVGMDTVSQLYVTVRNHRHATMIPSFIAREDIADIVSLVMVLNNNVHTQSGPYNDTMQGRVNELQTQLILERSEHVKQIRDAHESAHILSRAHEAALATMADEVERLTTALASMAPIEEDAPIRRRKTRI